MLNIIIVKVANTYGIVFITFHRIKWENPTATENTIPRIIGILKKFAVNIIKVIAIDVKPIVTKFTLNSSIIIINIFPQTLQEKFIEEVIYTFTTPWNSPWEIKSNNSRNTTWLVLVG